MRGAPRVVLDTNVLVSALVFGGAHWNRLRAAWQSGLFVPLASREVTEELLRVLQYPKFSLAAAERESLLAEYLPWVEVVEVPALPLDLAELRDPEDAKFLLLAQAGSAVALVTGDEDLLVLRERWKRVAIMTPAEFMEWLDA